MSSPDTHNAIFFSFPESSQQIEPDKQRLSRLYRNVHKRLASIANSAGIVSEEHKGNYKKQVDDNCTHSIGIVPSKWPENRTKDETVNSLRFFMSDADGLKKPILHFPAKAPASLQTVNEPVIVIGDVSLSGSSIVDSMGNTRSMTTTFNPVEFGSRLGTNQIPGFALMREMSSDSESAPAHQERRPSIVREQSISTVLKRLRNGVLSREFWMKDETCSACFLCDATFTSEPPVCIVLKLKMCSFQEKASLSIVWSNFLL